jgi:hypothetical protein
MSSLAPSLRLDTLPPGRPRLSLGPAVLNWAHEYLVQPNGPRAGEPWTPTPRQARFFMWWYAIDEDGRWLFTHSVRRLAKGAGKSPNAAVESLIQFLGPSRVADIDGATVVGKRADLPWVQLAAVSEGQTTNTMRMVRAFAPKRSRIVSEYSLDPGKTLYYEPGGGQLQVITSSAASAEGAEVTGMIADETEHWAGPNGGVDLMETIEDNLTKSASRLMETCNAPVPGHGSVAEAHWDAWLAQEEGRSKSQGRILYDAVIAPPDTDLSDESSLMAALESVYDGCFWVDLATIRDKIWSPKTKPSVARRKYLNQMVADEDSWVTPQQWANCADASIVVADGDAVVMFFDGSKSRDATALVGCRVSDGHVFTIGVWEPAGTGFEVPVDEVDATVAQTFDRYNVVGFFADVREWESFAKVSWPREYGDRLLVEATSKTVRSPEPIAWDMRTRVREFTEACELTSAEIEDGLFTHDGDSRLARHVVNARRRVNRHGVSIGKESPDSPKKIDAAVCMVGARMVRRLAVDKVPTKRKSRRLAY